MAAYTGIAASIFVSGNRRAVLASGESVQTRASPLRFSSAIKHGGLYSRELLAGEQHAVWYGTTAGEKTISVWCYAAVVGTALLLLLDLASGDPIAKAANTVTGTWEKLTITPTVQKAVYVLLFMNAAKADGDKRAYFDDLV